MELFEKLFIARTVLALSQELLETKKLTYSGIKQVYKVLNELLTKIKK